MSIGKFFILAILLPMATIYLTLTLKGQKDNIFSFYDERQPEALNSQNLSSNNDDIESEISGANFYYEEGEESETYDDIQNETVDSAEEYEPEESFESIEEIIKFKKTKTNHIVNSEKIVEPSEKFESKVAIIDKKQNSETRSNTSKTVTTNKNLSPVTKKSNSQKINKNKTKISKKKSKPARLKQNKIAKINKPTANNSTKRKKASPKKSQRVAKKPVKSSKTAFVVKQPKKQVIKPKTKLTLAAPTKKSKPVNLKFIESAFDEDDDYEEDEIIAIGTASVKIAKPVESAKPAESERFSSNPCSGRASRYIARCRKR